jgi:phosphomevalonate kinase
MKIIGFAGTRKSGKTAAAHQLMGIDERFRRMSFADPLKDMYCKTKGIGRETLDNVSLKEFYRRDMQEVSTQMKIDNGDDYFAKMLLDQVLSNDFVVIDDVRFVQELKLIRQAGGIVYQVYSDPHKRAERGWEFDPIIDTDISETELGWLTAETFHLLGGGRIYNNHSTKELRNEIFNVLLRHNFVDQTLKNGDLQVA